MTTYAHNNDRREAVRLAAEYAAVRRADAAAELAAIRTCGTAVKRDARIAQLDAILNPTPLADLLAERCADRAAAVAPKPEPTVPLYRLWRARANGAGPIECCETYCRPALPLDAALAELGRLARLAHRPGGSQHRIWIQAA